MKLAILRERSPDEQRVALIPSAVKPLTKLGFEVIVESAAGQAAGHSDDAYRQAGAEICDNQQQLCAADVLVQVRALGACVAPDDQRPQYRPGQVVIGTCDPLGGVDQIRAAAEQQISLLALELIPRTTRAQSMDVLSSMASVAGYRAVILAAERLPKMFPLMMTAAGTLSPARVFVIGAGVAGLQAIATSRRLGAVVQAYDVRPAVREQVESLGAKFVEVEADSSAAEDKGGYAKAMDEAFYERQRQRMAEVAADSDVVISTAAIPGRQSPLLLTEDAVRGMPDGGVIVDLAAQRGGNCQLSQPDQTVVAHGVSILGPTNLPGEVPTHASQMFSKNVTTLLQHLVQDGQLEFDRTDEITAGTLATHGGEVVHARLREILELPPLASPDQQQVDQDAEPTDGQNAPTGQSQSNSKEASA